MDEELERLSKFPEALWNIYAQRIAEELFQPTIADRMFALEAKSAWLPIEAFKENVQSFVKHQREINPTWMPTLVPLSQWLDSGVGVGRPKGARRYPRSTRGKAELLATVKSYREDGW